MGESSAPRRPTHDTNTSRRQVNIHTHDNNDNNNNNTSSKQTQTYKYTMKITGLIASTMLLLMASAPSGLLAAPIPQNGDVDYKEPVGQEIFLPLVGPSLVGPFLRQDVPAPHGRKLALIPLADLADIGLGVQKIFNPTNEQVNSNDVRGLANTLQKYLPFPFLATGRQGSRGGGSSRKPTGGKPTG